MGSRSWGSNVARLLILFVSACTLLESTTVAYTFDPFPALHDQLTMAVPSQKSATKAWFMAGSSAGEYEHGVSAELGDHKRSGYIRTKHRLPMRPGFDTGTSRFGALMQMFKADSYRGKRMRFTAVVKSEDVYEWAGLWMRVDGPKKELLGFDNMSTRPIKNTIGWERYQVVLDVPDGSVNIAFGIFLTGPGQVWLVDVGFEETEDEPTGLPKQEYPDGPSNLDFWE
jgi:hypothetical protein